MRRAVEQHPQIKVTLRGKYVAEIMTAIGHAGEHPEGRFFPDTYRFAAGTSDRELYALALPQAGRDAGRGLECARGGLAAGQFL